MNRSLHPVESEEVMAYLDGELAAARAVEVAAHLDQCAECQTLAGDLRQVSQQAALWQTAPAPAAIAARVHGAAAAAAAPPKETRRRTNPWVLALGGVMGVLMLFAIAIPNLLRSRKAANDAMMRSTGLSGPLSEAQRDAVSPPSSLYLKGRAQAAQPAAEPTGPMVIRTAALHIITKEFENARAATEEIVRRHQGHIANLATSGQRDAARALAATLRIPAGRLDAALAELKKLGRVEQESQGGQEVTQQYVDLVARLSNARNTEQRLIEVLRERTGKVADILAVEKEIARVREEIERMEAERKGLENQVGFATVQLQLNEERKAALYVAPPSTTTRLWNAAVQGYRDLFESIVALLLFSLSSGPVIVFWLLVFFFPARYAWRKLKAAGLG